MTNDSYKVGYGKPPRSTQFKRSVRQGQTRKPELPYDFILGRKVTVIVDGKRKRMAADEAFLQQLINRGLTTDGQIRKLALEAAELASVIGSARKAITMVYRKYAEPGEVDKAMRSLNMATLLDPYRATAKLAIEPWLVEAALSRFDGGKLSVEQQKIIVDATRKPSTVKWPEWWTVHTT